MKRLVSFLLLLFLLLGSAVQAQTYISIRFGPSSGMYFYDMENLIDGSPTYTSYVDIWKKYADLWEIGIDKGTNGCDSFKVYSTYFTGFCDDNPYFARFFPREQYNTEFTIWAACFSKNGCKSNDLIVNRTKNRNVIRNYFDSSCSEMPSVSINQPSADATIGSWGSSTNPLWTYDNYDDWKCNCGGWTFYMSTSPQTIYSGRSESVSCATMVVPPPNSYSVGIDLSSWGITPNNASVPWYYWQAVMLNTRGDLQQPTETRKFCVAEKPTLPTLVSPLDPEKIPGLAGYFPITFFWDDPTSWGYDCTSNPVTFTLMFKIDLWYTVESITANNYSTWIITTSGKEIKWKVMARYGDYTAEDSARTCNEGKPNKPNAQSPADGALCYEDPVHLDWNDIDFHDACNLDDTENLRYEVFISTSSSEDVFYASVPSTQSYIDIPHSSFTVAAAGTTLYWRVRGVMTKNDFYRTGDKSDRRSFNLCRLEPPATPTGLDAPSSVTCASDGLASFTASWTAVTNWGAHCSPPPQATSYIYSIDGGENVTVSTTSATVSTSCTHGSHEISLVSFNGNQASSTAVSKVFSICATSAPEAPTPGTPSGGAVLVTTGGSTELDVTVNWTGITDWGRDCLTEATGFTVYFWKAGEYTKSSIEAAASEVQAVITVGEGSWMWTVVAHVGALESESLSEQAFDVCTQTSPAQPQPQYPVGIAVSDTDIEFTWADFDDWGELCGTTTSTKEFNVTVVHEGGTVLSATTAAGVTRVNITLTESGLWTWTVTASNGIFGIAPTSSAETVFFQGANCELRYPEWNTGDGLNSPIGGAALVQNAGNVRFSWDSVKSFGMTCTYPQTTLYQLIVDNGAIVQNTTDTEITLTLAAGIHSWRVDAVNENISTATATETFSLCIVTPPPTPTLDCVTTPQVRPLSVGWSATWSERCGLAGEYVVTVKALDGVATAQTITLTGYEQQSANLSSTLMDGNHTWTVTARINNMGATSANCVALYACTPQTPGKATLGATPAMSLQTAVTLSWSVDAADISSTSCTQFTEATFNASVWVARTDEIVASALVQAGDPMEFAADLFAGDFEWSVNTFNGYQWSEFSGRAAFTICIPEAIGNVTMVSPANNSHPVMQTLMLQWEALPTPESCGNTTTYTVILGDTVLGTTNETEVDAETTSLPMQELVADRLYWWAIRVDTQHYQLTTEPAYFMPCEATAPNAPELAWPTSAEVQPAVIQSVVVLEWNQTGTGNTCELGSEMRYNVLLSPNATFDTFEIFTSSTPYVVVKGLVDGRYFWKVIASNAAEVGTNESDAEYFDVCIAEGPSAPRLLDPPTKGAILRKAEDPLFEISVAKTFGRLCRNDSEAAAGYRLYVGVDEATMWAHATRLDLSTPTSFSANGIPVIRFDNVNLSYGQMFWTAGTTNADGIETRTEEIRLVTVCDAPAGVEQTEPDDRTADVDVGPTLRWTPAVASLWGFPCAENTGVNPHVSIYIYPVAALHDEDWNETADDFEASSSGSWWNSTPFVTIPNQGNLAEYTLDATHLLELNTTYAWRVGLHNGYEEKISPAWTFRTEARDCRWLTCLNGGTCDETTITCVCTADWTGDDCSIPVEKSKLAAILAGVLVPLLVLGIVAGIIAGILVNRRRKQRRLRVHLKAPGGDLRFSFVKAPGTAPSPLDVHAAESKVHEDASSGYAGALRIVDVTPSTELENVCKALLYAYERHGQGLAMVQALITREVAQCTSATVIFRSNTAATLVFKHFSKMVGLPYLFDTFASLLEQMLQKEADAHATERDIAENKKYTQLMTLGDTCEVDPTKIAEDDVNADDLLAVNALQLQLTAQRFLAQIFRSVTAMPAELRACCAHVRREVEARFPDAVTRSLGAFIFLRFFNCAASIPEAYGLVKDAPPEGVRRSLVLVTKILTTLSAGAHFGDKEAFMAQFNELLDNNQTQLESYYQTLTTGDFSVDPSKKVAIPDKLYEDSLAVLGEKAKKAFA